jgi:hypothetical protein
MTRAEVAAIRAWAAQLDRLWVIIPTRGHVAETASVSGYAEKHRVGETLLRLCDEVERLTRARLGAEEGP